VVRAIAPSLNPQTRYGQVLVELPNHNELAAGMFLHGRFLSGQLPVQVLPQSAIELKSGEAFVFVVNANHQVQELKVITGRRQGDQIEIMSGLQADVRVVESGGAFLVSGDPVSVVAKVAAPK